MMVPHAIVTVSLATAILPRLSALRRRRATCAGLGRTVGSHPAHRAGRGRCPFAAAAAGRRADLADVILGLRRRRPTATRFAPSLALFGIGAGLLHRPLPDAARLLRPRADPHGVPDPVRRSRPPTSSPPCCWSAAPAPRRPRRAGARLRACVRRRLGAPYAVLRRTLGGLATAGAWCASWSGWSSRCGAAGLAAWGVERRWPAARAERPGTCWSRRCAAGSPVIAGGVVVFCCWRAAAADPRGQPSPARDVRVGPDCGAADRLRWATTAVPRADERRVRSRVPDSIRPGDVLAGRYRLDDLLTESGGGRFWRATTWSSPHVAIHVIARRRRAGRRPARRRPALGHRTDPRLLRVLDADRPTTASPAWSTSGARAPPWTSCSPATARCRPRGGLARPRGGRRGRGAHAARRPPRPANPGERAGRPRRAGQDHRLRRRRRPARRCRPGAGVRPT